MTRHVALKSPCPLCQGRLTAVVRRVPLLGWHMVGLACEHGGDIRTSISAALGIRPPKAASNILTASSVTASNTWTRFSRPNARNAGNVRKSREDPSGQNDSRPYHAGARANGEPTCAWPPANGLTPRACTGNVWNVEAKRYGRQDGMRSGTHRPLRNVNASTRGFDICPGAGNAKNGERVKTCAPRPVLRPRKTTTPKGGTKKSRLRA